MMTMNAKYFLTASFALNITFSYYFFTKENLLDSEKKHGHSYSTPSAINPLPIPKRETTNFLSYFDSLVALGVTPSEAKTVVFHAIKNINNEELHQTEDTYWKPDPSQSKLQKIKSRIDSDHKIRASLIKTFGTSSISDPIFREAFEPLASSFTFLSSQDQIALQDFQLENRLKKEHLALERPQSFKPSIPIDRHIEPIDIDAILSPNAVLEYNLRYSYLSSKLRKSEAIFTKESFRETYQKLFNLHHAGSYHLMDPRTLLGQRDWLENLLGSEDTLKVIAALDERFTQFKLICNQHQLTRDQTYVAYKIILDSEAKLIEASARREVDQGYGISVIHGILEERKILLSDFLNADISTAILNSFSKLRTLSVKPPQGSQLN